MHKRIYRADRKLGVNLFDDPKSPITVRPYPIGQHGKRIKKRRSNYAKRLIERQKIRAFYNIKSSTLDTHIEKASSQRKPDLALIISLERRFDHIIYNLGFAPSVASARQLVTHKHFLVDGKPMNIPSYKVKPGELISVRPKSQSIDIINRCIANRSTQLPPYFKKQGDLSGMMTRLPENIDELGLNFEINATSVIESLR